MPLSPASAACVQHAMERAAATTRHQLARGLGSLALIASVAPLLGFLIQIPLFIDSFRGCGGNKSDCLAALVDLIAHSMLPLALGVGIGIPAFIAHRQFTATVETFTAEMNGATGLLAELSALRGARRDRNAGCH